MRRIRRAFAVPGACDLAEWNVPHAPHEHRSLLNEIDEEGKKGLAEGGKEENIFSVSLAK
jgi:hypothetical protein